MTYYLIQAGIDVLRFNLGLCVPDSCTIEDWKQINDAVNEKIWETASIPGSFMNTSGEYFSLNMTNVPASKKEPPIGDEIHLSIWLSLIVLVVSLVLVCSLKRMISPLEGSGIRPVQLEIHTPQNLNQFDALTREELGRKRLRERFDTFHQEVAGASNREAGEIPKPKIPSLKSVIESKELAPRSNPFFSLSSNQIQLSFSNIFSL